MPEEKTFRWGTEEEDSEESEEDTEEDEETGDEEDDEEDGDDEDSDLSKRPTTITFSHTKLSRDQQVLNVCLCSHSNHGYYDVTIVIILTSQFH